MSIFAEKLLDMASYSVTQVEAITGISSHKLRIWERRYNFINPSRTSTNIRFYTDEDLKMLINIGILTRKGIKVSIIDKMSREEISNKVLELEESAESNVKDDISSLIVSAINLDEEIFNRVFQRHLILKGFLATINELIYPFLSHLGVLWGTSRIIPAQEHFISNLVRQKIISAIDTLSTPNIDSPGIILFLFENEMHELSLLLSSFIAKNNGWRVYYLGQNVPLDNVIATAKPANIKLVMSMITTPRADDLSSQIKKLSSEIEKPVILSGIFDNMPEIANIENVMLVKNPKDFESVLNKFK
ncbi:MAG: MerR family transcriptional regulator [Marinilabiliales bacterium]|nr:MAG: MerR family transcriptional regulator [Marinilabiliales bacterium]